MTVRPLAGKVALVTGGASGIGAACAMRLAHDGAAVVVVDRAREQAEAVAAQVGAATRVFIADVTVPQELADAVAATVTSFGRLDIAVNCAGVSSGTKDLIADLDPAVWRRVTAINLDGVFNSMRAQLPAMVGSGSGAIVNVASVLGVVGQAGSAAYVAAKHGVIGLTKVAALEYADAGIRINAVAPAWVNTPLLADKPAEVRAELAARHPLGRMATAAEVAGVVAFLAGPDASFVTGSCYLVDGGFAAR